MQNLKIDLEIYFFNTTFGMKDSIIINGAVFHLWNQKRSSQKGIFSNIHSLADAAFALQYPVWPAGPSIMIDYHF
jgi:hypothetical protein